MHDGLKAKLSKRMTWEISMLWMNVISKYIHLVFVWIHSKFFFFFFFFARISMSLALNFLVFLKQTKNNSCSPLFLSLSLSLSNRQSLLSGSSFNDFYISPAFSRAKPFLKVKIIIKNVRFFFISFFRIH